MDSHTDNIGRKLLASLGVVAAVLVWGAATIQYFLVLQANDTAIVDAAGRNRMLSQRIGYFAERVARGRERDRDQLRDFIELHDVSLAALRHGGVAPGIAAEQELPRVDEPVLPLVLKAAELWEEYMAQATIVANEPVELEGERNQNFFAALEYIEDNSGEMLRRNNAVVAASVESHERKQVSLTFIVVMASVVGIAFLLIAGRFINGLIRSLIRERENLETSFRELMQTKVQEESSRKEAEESSKKYKEVSDALIGRELKMAEMKKDIESLKDKEE